jgi:hypothetical protein
MFDIGSFSERTCGGWSRRGFLRIAALAPLALRASAARAALETPRHARAKSVLLVWLGGGPSHVDLFDPKPGAPAEFRGPFSPIATRVPGAQFTELLPRLAARSHQFSWIRSNVNFNGGHREAGSIALTGASTAPQSQVYPPNFGSIVARERKGQQLPPFISVARGPIGDGVGPVYGYGGGVWGRGYDPFLMNCSQEGAVDVPSLQLLEGLTPERLHDRRALAGELGRISQLADSPRFHERNQLNDQAHKLLDAITNHKALDLSQEPARVREAYGKTSFGQSCLLGRRLVEAGVPYVQVNWSQFVEVFYTFSDYGWDTHADNFGLLADWHGPLLDQALSTLLDDLGQRGLLETTLLLCMGEFGRTPRINSIGSRDHWPGCYFSLWAGAGVQPGRAIGQSDPRGEYPASRPITPAMVGTTILELCGVNSAARASLGVLSGGEVIEELF